MIVNVDDKPAPGAYFIDFTYAREGNFYHAYVKLDDVVSWESEIVTTADAPEKRESNRQPGQRNWILCTTHKTYRTVENFHTIMKTCRWYAAPEVGSPRYSGRLDDMAVVRLKESEKNA
tara:strand:- start:1933 stop:2289 length:357 start_codon:yes stop_codon:yes gene_type:complete